MTRHSSEIQEASTRVSCTNVTSNYILVPKMHFRSPKRHQTCTTSVGTGNTHCPLRLTEVAPIHQEPILYDRQTTRVLQILPHQGGQSANMVTPHTDAEWISLLTWNSFSFWACSDPSLLQDLYEWEKVNTSGEMGNNQQALTLQPPEQPWVTNITDF